MSLRSALCEALVTLQRGAGLTAYDEIPSNRVYPYTAIGPVQIIPPVDPDECDEGSEVFVQLDVWSQLLGQTQTSEYVEILTGLLRGDLVVAGYRTVIQVVEDILLAKDPGGQLAHAVLKLRFELEPI